MNASAWGTRNKSYRLQIKYKKGSKTKIKKMLEGWKITGEGFHPSTNSEILIFQRSFQTQSDLEVWLTQHVDFETNLLDSKDEVKKIINKTSSK